MKHCPPVMRFVGAVLTALATIGTAANAGADALPWTSWTHTLGRDHALAGRVWNVAEGRFIEPEHLARSLGGHDYVLLGETHDNADHHRLQAWLIDRIAEKRRPAIVMEMISADQGAALNRFTTSGSSDAGALGPALDWTASGWPEWSIYQPIAEVALRRGLDIAAGLPGRAETRAVSHGGREAIDPARLARLGLDQPFPQDLEAALRQEIVAAHCDMLPETAAGPMAIVQQFRDAALARALIDAGASDGAILIAGSGHVRQDRGVPRFLGRLAPLATVAALQLVEVDAGTDDPTAYLENGPDGTPVADFLWFTPVAEREDPCERMRRHMQSKP